MLTAQNVEDGKGLAKVFNNLFPRVSLITGEVGIETLGTRFAFSSSDAQYSKYSQNFYA